MAGRGAPGRPGAAPLPDEKAREAIRTALDENLLVEAAAGTGKTTSLVERMVALIREGRATVDRLSAVTFTIKAAAQLDQRFQVALEKAAREEKDPKRRMRLEDALKRLDACFIGTIHAFCARLLRERPVEAGLDPGFQEMDDAADAAARRDAWFRYSERLFVEESPILSRLSEVGIALGDLRETYELLCENRDVVPAAGVMPARPDFVEARRAVADFLDRAAPEVPTAPAARGWDPLQLAIREALRLSVVLDLDRDPDFAEVLRALERGKKKTLNRWPDRKRIEALWEEIETLRKEHLLPALRRWREFLHPIALGAVIPAVQEFAAWRRREGRLNFQDLLLLARDLLRSHPEVRQAFARRFTPLLVDEFQDTDPIQAEVLLYLTGADTREADWRRLLPVPGSFFAVGDPKQSIYRFRRADIETYNLVRDTIERSGGRVLRLFTNFRSTGPICEWVNGAFETMFPAQRTAEQAPYVPLSPSRKDGGPGSGVFRIEIGAEIGNNPSVVAAADAERVADAIARAISERDREKPVGAGDVLLIVRRKKNMAAYARALERRGIPCEIVSGAAFRDSDEIASLVGVLQAIADPDDPVALVGALRGPIFGIDDRALFLFKQAGGWFSFHSEPPARADPVIARAFGLLRAGEQLTETLPPGAAISRFSQLLGWTVAAAADSLGDTRAGNLLKTMAAARDLSRGGESFREIVRLLSRLTEEGDAEEMTTRPGRPETVRILTLHRAKGLEARYVFLVDPTDLGPQPIISSIDRTVDPPVGHFLVAKKKGDHGIEEIARPPDWENRELRERQFLAAEETRLLYVAATRARDRLVVSVKKQQSGLGPAEWKGPWSPFQRFLTGEIPVGMPASFEAPSSDTAGIAGPALEEFRSESAARLAASREPGYSVATVTAIAHASGEPLPFRCATGRGMSWGSALHRLLEAAMRDPKLDLRAYAANVLAEEDRPATDLDEILAVVAGVLASDLWKRALVAKRCLVEVPFAMLVPSAEIRLSGGPPETVLQGAIDLVFEEAAGWTVIDYKSDAIAGNLEELARFYFPQIARYRDVWKELTGRPTRAGLFFISNGRTEWLDG